MSALRQEAAEMGKKQEEVTTPTKREHAAKHPSAKEKAKHRAES